MIKSKYLFLTLFFIFLIFDIGNIDAIRQGTEGFYLQVTKEMFEGNYFLTPRIFGHNHWSKPPLHFLFPYPLLYIFGDNYLLLSRISILLLSFYFTHLFAKKIFQHTNISYLFIFISLISSIGFLKYSRIFMMEMPLMLFTSLSILYGYEYLSKGFNSKSLIAFVFFLTSSVLIKGPVGLIMSCGALFLYLILDKKFFTLWKHFILLCLSGLFFSSIWFFVSYYKYGEDFFNYFFIRENLGKFTAKSYPISSVIQGLIIFSFPACLYFIPYYKKILNSYKDSSFHKLIFVSFFFLFFLWLIPSQRSHHYAIPSLFFFITLILINLPKDIKPFKTFLLHKGILFLFSAIGFLAVFLVFYFFEVSFFSMFNIFIFLLSFLIVFKFSSSPSYLKLTLSSFFIFSSLFIYLSPLLILPTIPSKSVELIPRSARVGIIFRKPFFISESLNNDSFIVHETNYSRDLFIQGSYYVMPKSVYSERSLEGTHNIVSQWNIWKRGIKPRAVIESIKLRDISMLQDAMLLVSLKADKI